MGSEFIRKGLTYGQKHSYRTHFLKKNSQESLSYYATAADLLVRLVFQLK